MHNTYICVHLFPSIMEQKCVSIALLIAESSMNQSTFVAISDDEQISKIGEYREFPYSYLFMDLSIFEQGWWNLKAKGTCEGSYWENVGGK